MCKLIYNIFAIQTQSCMFYQIYSTLNMLLNKVPMFVI